MPYEDYLKQLLSMEIAYILRRIWHLPRQCHTRIILNSFCRWKLHITIYCEGRRIWHLPMQCHTRIILNSFCRWKLHITIYCEGRRIWHLPMQCHTRILHLTAGLYSLVNRTISLKFTLLKRSCCTDSDLIKH